MNKVFKVIWSEARNAYVVVSEIAKNHGSKSCSTKKLLTMLIATGVMTCASMAPAMADNPASDDANKGWNLFVNDDMTTGAVKVQPDGYVNLRSDEGNIIVSAKKENFGPVVKVELSKNLNVDSIHAGDFFMNNAMGIGFGGDAYITQSGLNANNNVITNVAAGAADTDAVNVGQLNSAVAESGWKLATNGAVTSGLSEIKNNGIVNFAGDEENITVSKNDKDGITTVQVELNKNLNVDSVNAGDYFFDAERGVGYGGDAYITKNGLNANDKVITNVAEGVYNTDAVNVGQLKKVEEVAANANKGWNLSTNGVATKAPNVAPDEIVDFSGDKNISVSHDGTKVQVELNKDIDVNSVQTNTVQTNALNAKYNLSVGTANENGTMPFFVNSNGAFYAANGKLVVDKDGKLVAPEAELGKVTADEGVIGNVVLKDGVFYKHTALRDGELFVGDADGNYSQITTKGAKLGKVTVAEDGKISGVAAGAVTADSTDAVNGSQLHAVATEAGKHTTLSNGKNTTVTSTNKDGQVDYQVNVAGDLKDITSVSNGDSKINLNEDSISISNGNKSFAITNSGIGMSYITADYSTKSIMLGENGTTISGGLNVAGSKITGVAAGVADTDAVNVGQLKEAVEAGNTDTHIKPGEYGVGADNTVKMDVVDKNGNKVDTVTIKDVAKASDVGNVNNIASDIKNQDGSHTTVVDAVNNLNNKVGDLQYSKVEKGDIADGDSTTTAIGKLDQKLTDVAATAAKHTTVTQGDNITVTKSDEPNKNGGENYNVALKKDISLDSVTTGQTVMNKDGLKVGDKVSVTATAVTAGKTSISDEGVKVGDKTYISDKGLNANGQNITNVADGKVEKDSKDAINGGQLHQAKADINNRIDGVENQVVSNTNRINQLGSRVNKVGAGAAALAALHPMDFDPDDKLTFSAGYGNYGGENAAAIGAYYRPDEKVMFSVGGTVGNGENMVNAGVSFSLDRTNHVSNSRTAMAREILDLRAEVTELKAMVAKGGLGSIAEDKMKIFPDVAENHWAYEYVGKLAAAGIIEGYPDGNFSGDRMMSRYEFAAMLYRAMQKGAQLDSKIINEFAPEMGRIRVDRISGEDGDRDKIERVRVNDTKGERDHYGNKLAK